MRRWRLVVGLVLGLAVTGTTAGVVAPAQALDDPATVAVAGDVTTAHTYTVADLRALAQVTLTAPTGGDDHTFTGPSLEALVTTAAPVLPAGTKNGSVRVTVTLTGASGRTVTLALGELNAGFGNHPAVLALQRDGTDLAAPSPTLVVGGDADDSRMLTRVSSVSVAVHNLTPTPPPSTGAVTVSGAGRTTTLTAADLAALPSQTLAVHYNAAGAPTDRVEKGPLLDTVLRRAGYVPEQVAWVAGVASTDGYTAVVTPDETLAGKALQLSVAETDTLGTPTTSTPRLVVSGDVNGGRYVSNVSDLVVGCVPGTACGYATQGPAGPQGPAGATGAQGPQGVPGATGPAGRDAVVKCKLNRQGTKVTCKVKLVHGKAAQLTASLSHGHRVLGTSRREVGHGGSLVLRSGVVAHRYRVQGTTTRHGRTARWSVVLRLT